MIRRHACAFGTLCLPGGRGGGHAAKLAVRSAHTLQQCGTSSEAVASKRRLVPRPPGGGLLGRYCRKRTRATETQVARKQEDRICVPWLKSSSSPQNSDVPQRRFTSYAVPEQAAPCFIAPCSELATTLALPPKNHARGHIQPHERTASGGFDSSAPE
eukprot:scaffold3662_cov388-Prasinococcus_capsulatus_cf.AAC.12